MKRLMNISMLYWQNTGFRCLLAIVLVSGLLTKVFLNARSFLFAEEIFTLFFVIVMWLAFHIGILLKHQFSNVRSRLLPKYRSAHVTAFVLLYALLIALAVVWRMGHVLRFPWLSPASMTGVWGSCLLLSLFIIMLGYLSIGRALLYGYCVLLFLSVFAADISDVFAQYRWLVGVPFMVWVLGVAGLIARLSVLNEESFEYGHLLKWPPRDFNIYRYQSIGQKFFKSTPVVVKEKFCARKGITGRLRHWDAVKGDEPDVAWGLLWLVAGLYALVFFKVDWAIEWLRSVSGLFLMYVLTPLVIVAMVYYKRLIFWGYDLIRPVSRQAYFKDQAGLVFFRLAVYWLFTVLALRLIPMALFDIGKISTGVLGFLLLSACFSFLIISVLIVLSAIDSVRRIIINGALLSLMMIIFFDIVPELSLKEHLLCSWACLASGLIFIKQGYHAWCSKEFI